MSSIYKIINIVNIITNEETIFNNIKECKKSLKISNSIFGRINTNKLLLKKYAASYVS